MRPKRAKKREKKREKKNLLLRGIELTTYRVWSRCLTYYSTETFTSEREAFTLYELGVAVGQSTGTEPERGERREEQGPAVLPGPVELAQNCQN